MTPRELPDYLRPLPGPTEDPPGEPASEPSGDTSALEAPSGVAAASATAPEAGPVPSPETQPPATEPDPAPPTEAAPAPPSGAAATPPEGGEPTPPRLEAEETPGDLPGLIHPRSRGHSAAFITDLIVELGYATREAVDNSIAQARTAGRPPEELLMEQGLVDSEKLARAVAERYGLDFIDLAVFQVDMGAANLISVRSARRHQAVPVHFLDEETLLVAMADPTNVVGMDDMQMATGLNCRAAVAPAADVESLISRLSTLQSTVTEAIEDVEEEQEEAAEVTDLRASAEDAPVIKLVNSILGQAVSEGASDIHIEHDDAEMRVRFRIDGVLHEVARVPKRMVSGVISRVKIMSELDIAEKRVPQDGRVGVTIEDRRVDLRVTTLPTQRGEGASIRILDEAAALRTLDHLGMEEDERERFESSFRRPYGAVLVTGPTGSGKSTTLYAAVQELNDVDKNIVTIEDPVEYRLSGINQINVNRKAGLDFATGLRSVLRADPDVIMVGEIRDSETARIAVEAALTGHMVLSTLHTNDAPAAITRLQEMGIESFLTSSAIDCVVAQRLARMLCPHCKQRTVIPQVALNEAGFRVGGDLEAYEPVGCPRCHRIGYRGRIGIYSVMLLTERLKEMIVGLEPEAEIGKVAREDGMVTLREAGLAKVRGGVTSIEEVARVAS